MPVHGVIFTRLVAGHMGVKKVKVAVGVPGGERLWYLLPSGVSLTGSYLLG